MSKPQLLIPTQALKTALKKCEAVVNIVTPKLEYFQQLAAVCPEIEQMVNELAVKHAYIDQLYKVGLMGLGFDGEEARG